MSAFCDRVGMGQEAFKLCQAAGCLMKRRIATRVQVSEAGAFQKIANRRTGKGIGEAIALISFRVQVAAHSPAPPYSPADDGLLPYPDEQGGYLQIAPPC